MTPPIDDLDRIMAVMTAAFDPAYGEAWTRQQVEDALLLGNCTYGIVDSAGAEPQGSTPGAGFYLARTGVDETELLLLAVDPAHRRSGLGRALLNRFAAAAKSTGSNRLLLEMRDGNPAEQLYRAHGFTPIGRRPKYYRSIMGNRIDAITFALEI